MTRKTIFLCVPLAALSISLLVMAAPAGFDFLQEFQDMSAAWHRSSVILRVLALCISILGGCVAFIQSKKVRLAKKESITVIVSLVIAFLNGGLAF